MTQARHSVIALLNERTTQGFYTAIALACLAFAGMLVAPDERTEQLLSLAWLFMLSAIAFLLGKLGLELVLEASTSTREPGHHS